MLNFFRYRQKKRAQPANTRDAIPRLVDTLSTEIALLSELVNEVDACNTDVSTLNSREGSTTELESEGTQEGTQECDNNGGIEVRQKYPLSRLGRVLAAVSQVHLKLKFDPFQRQKFVLVKYLRPFSRTDETFGDNVRAIAASIESANCSELVVAHYTELMNLYIYLQQRINEIN